MLEEVAVADCAIEVAGADRADVFATAAAALADLMVDPSTVARDVHCEVSLDAPELGRLLFDWLAELIYLKDADRTVFPDATVEISGEAPVRLRARLCGGVIAPPRTQRRADAKAPTFHLLEVAPDSGGWHARFVIDI